MKMRDSEMLIVTLDLAMTKCRLAELKLRKVKTDVENGRTVNLQSYLFTLNEINFLTSEIEKIMNGGRK